MDVPANPSRRKWSWAASTIARSFSATMAALDVRFADVFIEASPPLIKDRQHWLNLQRPFPHLGKRTLLHTCGTFVPWSKPHRRKHEDRDHRSGQYRIGTRQILPQTTAHRIDRKLARPGDAFQGRAGNWCYSRQPLGGRERSRSALHRNSDEERAVT